MNNQAKDGESIFTLSLYVFKIQRLNSRDVYESVSYKSGLFGTKNHGLVK